MCLITEPAWPHLVAVSHERSPRVLWPQETVHQHGPAQRKVEADVLLEVTAELVTVQVVAEAEALPGDQHVHLVPDWGRQQGLHPICRANITVTTGQSFLTRQDR